jgi:hypothetical protein
VQAGYVVAAPTFPLSSGPNGVEGALVDTDHQPGDMSFVLTEVLKLSEDSANPLHNLLESDHVAAAGHSLGAITVLGFYSKQYADSRFKAVVDESGAGARPTTRPGSRRHLRNTSSRCRTRDTTRRSSRRSVNRPRR